jgi:hypothetical protein
LSKSGIATALSSTSGTRLFEHSLKTLEPIAVRLQTSAKPEFGPTISLTSGLEWRAFSWGDAKITESSAEQLVQQPANVGDERRQQPKMAADKVE